ncbi:MAG: hypothetical protein JXQ72_03965, partial [Anaerolineae bacterium]|nr:hypothetical protein [Anaerolineae bacterium]
AAIATAVPSPTPYPSPTPMPTLTSYRSPTPLPTWTPYPTMTPIPTATPGSPAGTGCQYARNPQPVNVNDMAAVTLQGVAVRFRSAASLNATLLGELNTGIRMRVLSGPFCADGYRWWQVQLEATGQIGFLADSNLTDYWIERATIIPTPVVSSTPTPLVTPVEYISFVADRYTINAGECVIIQWDVENIQAVYYQGVGVTGHDSRRECPASTTVYTLRVIRRDSSEVTRTIQIIVN